LYSWLAPTKYFPHATMPIILEALAIMGTIGGAEESSPMNFGDQAVPLYGRV